MNKMERMEGETAWEINKNAHVHGGYRAGSGKVQTRVHELFHWI